MSLTVFQLVVGVVFCIALGAVAMALWFFHLEDARRRHRTELRTSFYRAAGERQEGGRG